jgi:hypothetical protein
MSQVRFAFLVLLLIVVCAEAVPAVAFATSSNPSADAAWPASMLDSPSEADGTVADELTFAIMATLAGVVLVSLVFVNRRKES